MYNLILRLNKIVVGSILIAIAMLFTTDVSGLSLLALAAVPIISLGMFDWHPLEFLVGKAERYIRDRSESIGKPGIAS